MISKKEIIAMAKHVTRRSQNIPDRRLLHPKREWGIGVLVFFAVVIAGFVVSAQQFSYYASLEERLPESTSKVVEYKQGDMAEVLRRYEEQTFLFQQLRNGIVPQPKLTEEAEEDAEEGETTASSSQELLSVEVSVEAESSPEEEVPATEPAEDSTVIQIEADSFEVD